MKDNFRESILKIRQTDQRYALDAYCLVSEAVTFTAKKHMRNGENRHVSGQELVKGFAEYALMQYGPMTSIVLKSWGINSSRDVGVIVFNMIGEKLLRASENDSLEDFNEGLDFAETFERPFAARNPVRKPTPPIIA